MILRPLDGLFAGGVEAMVNLRRSRRASGEPEEGADMTERLVSAVTAYQF
jgi:hypothetical protein